MDETAGVGVAVRMGVGSGLLQAPNTSAVKTQIKGHKVRRVMAHKVSRVYQRRPEHEPPSSEPLI